MRTHGKQYRAAVGTLEPKKLYTAREAVDRVKAVAFAKFDESIDVAVRLGVDPKHADQVVRGTVSLPHGTGKTVRVLAIAAGGVLVMKVNVRSLKIVTSTGVIIPISLPVFALNCFTKSMMLMPWGPSAVPTGGAGVACPAGTCSFTTAVIGLAMCSSSRARLAGSHWTPRGRGTSD